MPNWVKTKLIFHQITDEQFEDVINRFCKLTEDGCWCLDFQKIIPMPDNVFRGNLSMEDEKKYPGDLNWYGWSNRHWGTKWNACYGDISRIEHSISFSTAWAYPAPVVEELAKQTLMRISAESLNEDYAVGAEWAEYQPDQDTGEIWVQHGCYEYGTGAFWECMETLWGMTKEEVEDEEND